MFYLTWSDPQVEWQLIKIRVYLFYLSAVCASRRKQMILQNHCRGEEYDIEENKKCLHHSNAEFFLALKELSWVYKKHLVQKGSRTI